MDGPWYDAAALVASGAVGIGVADTLFFRALNLLGASRSAVVECGYTPAVVFFSILFLGEALALSFLVNAVLHAVLLAVPDAMLAKFFKHPDSGENSFLSTPKLILTLTFKCFS